MKYLLVLMLFLVGCNSRETVQGVQGNFDVKIECKKDMAEGYCKYTNRRGMTVCTAGLGPSAFTIPCEFYEGI
jgi:hypothetical protein